MTVGERVKHRHAPTMHGVIVAITSGITLRSYEVLWDGVESRASHLPYELVPLSPLELLAEIG